MTTLGRALAGGLLLAGRVCAQSEGQGYAEVRTSSFLRMPGESWQVVERVRPTFDYALAERVNVVATVEGALAQGRAAPRVRSADDYLDVDRLYLDAYSRTADVRVGRQAIHWGSAQYFNPTDPFPEVLLAEPWRPRRGANAVRAFVGLNERTDVTAVGGLDDALRYGRAAARFRTNLAGTDFAVVGSWPGKSDWLAGVDLRGTVEIGWWVEAAVRTLGTSRAKEEVSIGVDYSFPVLEKLVPMVQYHRDGANRALRDSILAGLTLQIDPDLSASGLFLRNLGGDGGFAVPTVTWAVLGWLEVAASGRIAFVPSDDAVLTAWTRASF